MQKVDLVLRNAKYLDADKREFVEGDIAIKDGKIVGFLCKLWYNIIIKSLLNLRKTPFG